MYPKTNVLTSATPVNATAAYTASARAAPNALGIALNRPCKMDCLNIIKAIGPKVIDNTTENTRDR